MKFSRFLSWVVPLAALCGAGLLVAQVFWFFNAFDLKKDQFEDKVFVLLNQIGSAVNGDDTAQNELMEDLGLSDESLIHNNTRINSQNQHSIRKTIDLVFEANHLNTPYYYGISKWDECDNGEMILTDLPENVASEQNLIRENILSCPLQAKFGGYSLIT